MIIQQDAKYEDDMLPITAPLKFLHTNTDSVCQGGTEGQLTCIGNTLAKYQALGPHQPVKKRIPHVAQRGLHTYKINRVEIKDTKSSFNVIK